MPAESADFLKIAMDAVVSKYGSYQNVQQFSSANWLSEVRAYGKSQGWIEVLDSQGNFSHFLGQVQNVEASNGFATTTREVLQVTGEATETGSTATITSATTAPGGGAGLLATDLGTFGAIIAPFLGIKAGMDLYNLYPNLWNGIASALQGEGFTLDNDTNYLMDGAVLNKDGTTSIDERVLNIFKNAFINEGLYKPTSFTTDNFVANDSITFPLNNFSIYDILEPLVSEWSTLNNNPFTRFGLTAEKFISCFMESIEHLRKTYANIDENKPFIFSATQTSGTLYSCFDYKNGNTFTTIVTNIKSTSNPELYRYILRTRPSVLFNIEANTDLTDFKASYFPSSLNSDCYFFKDTLLGVTIPATYPFISVRNCFGEFKPSQSVQSDAIYPTESQTIAETYPDLQPQIINNTTYYPVSIPSDTTTQQISQTGTPDGNVGTETLVNIIYQIQDDPTIDPGTNPDPDPEPEVDPEPQPDPDPDNTPTNPVDPNPDPDPGDEPILPAIPATVQSNRLFTVYNPTWDEVNALGAFLWSDDIITQLLKIWQNPLNGIISLTKVYAVPVTGERRNIILGYLDSGVQSNVVLSQFTNVDCGTVTIPESKNNATDYSPYSSVHLYLPFIGIVELDADEVMNGTIRVQYIIDVYTGTCIAEVTITRNPDLPNQAVLYSFSGNCSQQIPLTSSEANGFLSALVNTVTAGLSMGAGGAIAAATHSMTHELVHIAHSGTLSANAGIMGIRTPYAILGRRHGYDANGYNEIYGFPANATVYLNNLSGYVRVKGGRLQTRATQDEYNEIMQLLREGVIL